MRVGLLMVLLCLLAACAGGPHRVDHAFGFDAVADSPGVEMLDYRYGRPDVPGSRMPEWVRKGSGVGTGDEAGGFDARTSNPTPYVVATAERAYADFAREADAWLALSRPLSLDGVAVALAGFSRGAASAVAMTRLVNDRGLIHGGHTLIPPGWSVWLPSCCWTPSIPAWR
jgi:hypothetical protein